MKLHTPAAAALVFANAYAQSSSSSSTQTYTTTVYEDCPTPSSLITVTKGVTITYCPECEMSSSANPRLPGYTTVYTTTYLSLCPTGIVPATYTVTESCTDATPTWTPGPQHIPNGFTVTVKECTVCDSTPTAVTITEPCGCEASEGMPLPSGNAASTTPTAPIPTPPCTGEECGGSSNQSPTMPAEVPPPVNPECNGDDCGGSGIQSPTNPGGPYEPISASSPQNPPYPTTNPGLSPSLGSSAPGNNSGSGSSPSTMPFVAGASSFTHVGVVSSAFLAIIIGALAFAL